MSNKLICPRRVMELGKDPEPTDSWEMMASFVGTEHEPYAMPTCSWCGSMHPDKLLEGLLKDELFIGGSDKGYKWYIEKNRITRMAGEIEIRDKVGKFYTPHLQRHHCEAILKMWREETLNHSMYVQPYMPAMAEDAPPWLVGDKA